MLSNDRLRPTPVASRRHPRIRSWIVLAASLAVALAWAGGLRAEDEEIPIKQVKMDAENWKWSPNQIRVQEGTKLVLKIRSFDATHRFDLKQFGQKVVLPQDETTTVEFVVDKPGKYKWKCGRPCGDGCPKMRGTLTVTEKVEEEPEG